MFSIKVMSSHTVHPYFKDVAPGAFYDKPRDDSQEFLQHQKKLKESIKKAEKKGFRVLQAI